MRYWAVRTWEGTKGKRLEQVKALVRMQKRLYGAICRQAGKDGLEEDLENLFWDNGLMKPHSFYMGLLKFNSPRLYWLMKRYLTLEEEIEKRLALILVIMN